MHYEISHTHTASSMYQVHSLTYLVFFVCVRLVGRSSPATPAMQQREGR